MTNMTETINAANNIVGHKFEDKEVRSVMDQNGEPWFVAKDVCNILGLDNSSRAISRLRDKDKGVTSNDTPGGSQAMAIISEFGLYELVLSSRKENAQKFRYWICDEVIPSIRKTGSYSVDGQFNIPKTLSEALFLSAQLQAEKEANAHKVEAYDAFLTADNAQSMNEVAKCLGVGRNKLFALLREKGCLMRNNLPYQQYMDAELFTVREVTVPKGDYVENKTQTLVTARGVDFIKDLLHKNDGPQYLGLSPHNVN